LESSPGILLQQLGEEAVGELGGCALLVRREVKDVGQQPCGVRPSGSLRMLGGRVLSPTARRQPNGDWPNAAAVSTSAIVGSTSSGTNSSARSLRTTAGTKSMGPSSRCMNKDINSAKPWVSSFATWLEDAAIPSRVIDELMGHTGGRRDRGAGGSPMGRVIGRRPRRWWRGDRRHGRAHRPRTSGCCVSAARAPGLAGGRRRREPLTWGGAEGI
jgi:hypothetical protein